MERITMKKLATMCRSINQGAMQDKPVGLKVEHTGDNSFVLYTLARQPGRKDLEEVILVGSAREVWAATRALETCLRVLRRAEGYPRHG